MEEHIAIPHDEIREEDLKVGARVHVTWDPYDCKPEAIGLITAVRVWDADLKITGDTGRDIVIHIIDERTGAHREASLADQIIDILSPAEDNSR
jgi:hypothetical protein